MKTTKFLRIAAFVTSLAMAFLMLAGCGTQKTSTETSQSSAETSAAKAETTAAETAAGIKEPVVIKWATWENIYVAREMAEKFNAKNPGIKVEVMDLGGWFGNDKLTSLAASGEMPDIFEVENPVIPVQNKWVIDLKPFLDKETEKKFYDNFVQTGTFDGKVIMLPAYIFVHGIVVNLSAVKAANLPVPGYDWTLDELKEIVIKTTKGTTIGIWSVDDLLKHIPPQMNDDLGWGCWNAKEQRYVLGEEFKYAVEFAKELRDKKTTLTQFIEHIDPWSKPEGAERDAAFKEIADIYKEKFGDESDWNLWLKGNVVTGMDFSWNIGFDKDPNFGGWEWDFYPFPVKDKGDISRPGIVCDSYAISASAKDPEAAFKFLKYIAYDPSSFDDRVDIIKNYNKEKAMEKYPDLSADRFWDTLTFDHIPAINDQAVLDRWCELNNVKPGIKYILDNLDRGYIDGFKFVPDFDTSYHKTIYNGVRDEVFWGNKSIEDIAPELEKKANDIYNTAVANMRK